MGFEFKGKVDSIQLLGNNLEIIIFDDSSRNAQFEIPKKSLKINDEIIITIYDNNSEVKENFLEVIVNSIEKTKFGRVHVNFEYIENNKVLSLRDITIDEAREFSITETYKVTIKHIK